MIELLSEIERLLRRNGYHGQADAVADIIADALADRQTDFEREIVGLAIWGGAGSVADADLGYGSPQSAAESAADKHLLRRALIELGSLLETQGLATARIRSVANTFQSWEARGA